MTGRRLFPAGVVFLAVLLSGLTMPANTQTISSGANQSFTVSDPATTISTITITDDATATIIKQDDIRIRIPATFNMIWDTTITSVTYGGSAAGKMKADLKAYEDGDQTMVLDVNTNFDDNDTLTVSGAKFTNFTAASAADNLELEVDNGDTVADTDDKTITITALANAIISSAANQSFNANDPATAVSTMTVTDTSPATITIANDIRIRIPSSFNMIWDTTDTTATIGGGAFSKVSTTVTYQDSNQTLVIAVTTDFAAGDQITISGLSFTSFSAVSAADNLELEANNDDVVTDTDDKTITIIGAYGISSAANQTFVVGNPATTISTITIIDDAATATITKNDDIRIRIPATFNMTWDTTITTVTYGGTAAGKMKANLKNYEDGDQTMVMDVNTDFAVGDTLTVSGAKFTAFTAASAADNLELEIDNGGTVADTDDKTITILDGPSIALVKSLLTVSDPINGATNPKAIQGAYIVYTVTATNSGLGATDSDTVVVLDAVPPDTEIFVNDFSGPGTGPVEFIDGAIASGLTYTFTSLSSGTDDIEFSDDDGSTYAYTPTADADGFDSSVTNIRVIPKSAFDAASGGDTPSFSLKYQIRVL